jgi:hypothetical protein
MRDVFLQELQSSFELDLEVVEVQRVHVDLTGEGEDSQTHHAEQDTLQQFLPCVVGGTLLDHIGCFLM